MGPAQWCFTPTAAVAIFAGCYFARLSIAALVPVAILGISDLRWQSHDNVGVMLATYAVMTVPVLFGRWLRRAAGRRAPGAVGDLRAGSGDAVLAGVEFRRVGVSERL